MSDPFIASVRQHVRDLGYELVDLRRTGTTQRPVLQVRVDRPETDPGRGVTADDCATVSRSLERFLEESGLVGPRYVLEVSSPGVERPIRWIEHWRRFVGHRVRVNSPELPGKPIVQIVGVPDDEHVTVRLPDGSDRTLALAAVREAKLAVDWNAIAKRRS